ncbi:hypothetical protein PtA15_1A642 [Puccinia triticina]|uniref:Secreted protein n=1 Tax=Puccinia triticina TaxID=208348 RepID=A0ABY7CBK8_9BASI|nr:uncharacterized protein PtA15_1A642 [Puccinia triticina]WAQ81302.1 hypothetical protein PtA15_1A642 [Puccinia triticina]
MKLCTFAYMLVLTLVLSASFATQSPVPCAACKHETAMLIPNLPSTIRDACGKPLPGGGTCQVERRKNFYKCKRPECGQYSRGNATSKVEDCIHRHKEHIQGPFENPTVLSTGSTGLSAPTTGQTVPASNTASKRPRESGSSAKCSRPKGAHTSAHQSTQGVPKGARTSSELDTMQHS